MNPLDQLDPSLGPPDYVFGYGSLIQSASRSRTIDVVGVAMPARVQGLRRAWNARGSEIGFSATFLGVTEDSTSSVNGVLAPVYPNEWEALDARERGYLRQTVDRRSIEFVSDIEWEMDERAEVHVYLAANPQPPTERFPILQSYVDICLDGCLTLDETRGDGDAFTREFLQTTAGWSPAWVNDRLFPRAPFRNMPRAGVIDRLLHETYPEEFAAITIE